MLGVKASGYGKGCDLESEFKVRVGSGGQLSATAVSGKGAGIRSERGKCPGWGTNVLRSVCCIPSRTIVRPSGTPRSNLLARGLSELSRWTPPPLQRRPANRSIIKEIGVTPPADRYEIIRIRVAGNEGQKGGRARASHW